MSKIVQKGAATAMRVRSMGSVSSSTISPEKLGEFGQKINPAQTSFGPKCPKIEKWQQHYQDPLRQEVPVFRRKGPSDDILTACTAMYVFGVFGFNIFGFATRE